MKKFPYVFLVSVFFTAITAYSQQTANILTLKPNGENGKDALIIQSKKNTKKNFGDSPYFIAANKRINREDHTMRSLIEFKLSELPEGATVTKATLDLYAWNSNSGYGNHFCNQVNSNACILKRIITPWEESKVSWKKQPLTTEVNQVVIPMSRHENTKSYKGIDVTKLIQDMINNPEEGYGIMMMLETENGMKVMNFCSSDCDDETRHPKLIITYSF